MTQLRIGLLGAARISDLALVTPAHNAGHRLVAVAARDPERAQKWADERQVERVVPSYADLVNDPEVDVVYNPLPNSLHAPWNMAAIKAGKHLLSEKPFASNAGEAALVRDVAAGSDMVVFEAFHYRYHPIFERLLQVTTDGTIGPLKQLQVTMSMPAPADDDLRWSWPLAGGALMDLGCYAIHVIRSLALRHGGAPELISAEAVERPGRPQIDESARLTLRLPEDVPAIATVTMDGPWEFSIEASGARGSARIANFVNVHQDDRLTLHTADGKTVEHHGRRSTYHYQMDALTAAVTDGQPFPTGVDDAIANMRMIDACYLTAGLQPRQGHAAPREAPAGHATTGDPR
jgi:predicted dehydrogenase